MRVVGWETERGDRRKGTKGSAIVVFLFVQSLRVAPFG